jgi:hypothetical protein
MTTLSRRSSGPVRKHCPTGVGPGRRPGTDRAGRPGRPLVQVPSQPRWSLVPSHTRPQPARASRAARDRSAHPGGPHARSGYGRCVRRLLRDRPPSGERRPSRPDRAAPFQWPDGREPGRLSGRCHGVRHRPRSRRALKPGRSHVHPVTRSDPVGAAAVSDASRRAPGTVAAPTVRSGRATAGTARRRSRARTDAEPREDTWIRTEPSGTVRRRGSARYPIPAHPSRAQLSTVQLSTFQLRPDRPGPSYSDPDPDPINPIRPTTAHAQAGPRSGAGQARSGRTPAPAGRRTVAIEPIEK